MARKLVLLGGFLFLFTLFLAVPALAEYLGPNRHVVQVIQERNPSNDYWTCTNRLPPLGVRGTCILQNPSNPCPDAGGHHPSREQQSAWCQWGTNYADWGGCGCTAAYTTRTVETDLPEATIAGELVGCSAVNGWCSAAATLHLTGGEPLAGESILAVEGTRNGEPFACGGATCDVPLIEGANAFTYWAISSFGDSSRMGTADVQVDTLPPALSADAAGTQGEGGWWVSSVTVSASASDAPPGSGLASFDRMIDGEGWIPYAGDVLLGDGVHDLRLRAIDGAGHAVETPYTLRVDTIPPGCSLNDPGQVWLTGGVTVTGVAADSGSGPGRVEVSTNGGDSWETAGLSPDGGWSAGWDTRGGSDGGHVLVAQCWDAAGNGSTSETLSVSVDNAPPRIGLPERWSLGETAWLEIEEHGSGLAAVRIVLNGGDLGQSVLTYDASSGFPTSVMWDGRFNGVVAPQGEYAVAVEASDAAGNTSGGYGTVVVPSPQVRRARVPTSTPRLAPSATAVSPTVLADPSATGIPASVLPARLSTPTVRPHQIAPLAPAYDSAPAVSESPAEEPGVNGTLWGPAALALAACAAALALSRKERREKQLEAELHAAAQAAGVAAAIRSAADQARGLLSASAAVASGTGGGGSKPSAQVRPSGDTYVPAPAEAAHNAALDRKMERIDEQAVAEQESLDEEARRAVVEARQAEFAQDEQEHRTDHLNSDAFLGAPRPASVPMSEWRWLSLEERAGIAEQAERDRQAELRAAAAAIGAGTDPIPGAPVRNAQRAEEEARSWQAGLAGPAFARRGELTAEDLAEVTEQIEIARERWRAEVIALSAKPSTGFSPAFAASDASNKTRGTEDWLAWQESIRRLTAFGPVRLSDILGVRSPEAFDQEQLDALRGLLIRPSNTAAQPTLPFWRLTAEVTGRSLEDLAMELLGITPWQRDMVGGVGLAESRSVGPVAMLVFSMVYYNRVIDEANSYWSGHYAAARGFADLGSTYDLVDPVSDRTFEGRDFAAYLRDSLEGGTRQNGYLLFSSDRWWDPEVRWSFTHLAAAVAAQDLGWRVIAGYALAGLTGEDAALFLNDAESAWWRYQQALMDAGVLHYETTEEAIERYEANVATSLLRAAPTLASDPTEFSKRVADFMAGLTFTGAPDANELQGVMEIARILSHYGNQYASNPNPDDLVEFGRSSGSSAYERMTDGGELLLSRYAYWVYTHTEDVAASAESLGLAEAVGSDALRDHFRSLVTLLNTAGGIPNAACTSYFWSPGADAYRIDYGSPSH